MHMAAAKGGFREGAKRAMSPKMPNIVQHDTETTQCCMVCSAIKTPSMASNYAFHFHLALNFRLFTLKCSSFWGTPSHRPPDLPPPPNSTFYIRPWLQPLNAMTFSCWSFFLNSWIYLLWKCIHSLSICACCMLLSSTVCDWRIERWSEGVKLFALAREIVFCGTMCTAIHTERDRDRQTDRERARERERAVPQK